MQVFKMGHVTNYKKNVKFWNFWNYYDIEGRLSAEGRMCPKIKKKQTNC
jgi:hypothetical protein